MTAQTLNPARRRVEAPARPTCADEAADLAQKVNDRAQRAHLTTPGRMVLTEKGRALCIRETVTYRLDKSGGETANLIRFLDPDNIAGTGFLSIDKADGAQAVKERHRLLGRQTENGILCEVLESVPALLGLRLRKPRQAVTAP